MHGPISSLYKHTHTEKDRNNSLLQQVFTFNRTIPERVKSNNVREKQRENYTNDFTIKNLIRALVPQFIARFLSLSHTKENSSVSLQCSESILCHETKSRQREDRPNRHSNSSVGALLEWLLMCGPRSQRWVTSTIK